MQLRHLASSLVFRVLVLAVAITLLGTTIRFMVLSNTMREGIEELVTSHLASEAAYVAGDIDEKIRLRRQLLETVARQMPRNLLDQPQALASWLAERQTLAPHFSLGMAVMPLSGHGVIAEYPQLVGRSNLDFASAEWFRTASDQAVFAISKPSIGRLAKQGLIIMAAPILDGRGRVVAVIQGVTLLDAPGFLNLIQNHKIGNSGGFLLISPRDKMFVAASMSKMRLQPTPPPGANRLHDRAMAGWRGVGITVNAFGIEEVVAFHDVPSANWFVVARMPTDEAFQSVDVSLDTLVHKGGAVALIVLALFAIFLFLLLRPLRKASQQIRQMADGRLPLAPLPVVRNDEVGEMVDGFNYLVSKVRENEERMTQLAHYDALTRLPNRLSFLLRAEQTVALVRRQKGRLALMFIDLDGFKPINDTLGHAAGDLLLRQVAHRLVEGFREADLVARFGGDEFVVLLTETGDEQAVARLAAQLLERLGAPFRIDEQDVLIGASIGIAFMPDDAEDIRTLIAQADAAMYDAKRAGRNCSRFAKRLD